MNETFLAKATIAINAPASRVWDALTKPDLIRQYLFGTQVTTDWRAGSPITYEGTWDGKAYKATKPFATNWLPKTAERG